MKHLILGGTGTLGTELTKQILYKFPKDTITVFSRSEHLQKEMCEKFGYHPRLSFVIGDIRNPSTLEREISKGYQSIFHVAALKHVPIMEANPEESVYTNVLPTITLADLSVKYKVKYFSFSSTDKACYPINAYGMSKALSERILINRNYTQEVTNFKVFRWANVMASKGSAIPLFISKIKSGQLIDVTDKEMTRFWISISDAAKFMLDNFRRKIHAEMIVPEMGWASVLDVINCLAEMLKRPDTRFHVTGIRPGEKLHETLYPGMTSGTPEARRLTKEELKQLLRPFI